MTNTQGTMASQAGAKAHLVVVDDVNDDAKLALEGSVVDEAHTAGLDESVEAHLGCAENGSGTGKVE